MRFRACVAYTSRVQIDETVIAAGDAGIRFRENAEHAERPGFDRSLDREDRFQSARKTTRFQSEATWRHRACATLPGHLLTRNGFMDIRDIRADEVRDQVGRLKRAHGFLRRSHHRGVSTACRNGHLRERSMQRFEDPCVVGKIIARQ